MQLGGGTWALEASRQTFSYVHKGLSKATFCGSTSPNEPRTRSTRYADKIQEGLGENSGWKKREESGEESEERKRFAGSGGTAMCIIWK